MNDKRLHPHYLMELTNKEWYRIQHNETYATSHHFAQKLSSYYNVTYGSNFAFE